MTVQNTTTSQGLKPDWFNKTDMGKTVSLLLIISLFLACNSSSKKMDEEQVGTPLEKQEEISVEEDFDVLEEEDLSNYQIAAQKHKDKDSLPYQVFLKPDYNHASLNFQGIIKILENCFVLEYRTYAAEVENVYFITFDYNGNQLDAEIVNTYAVDLEGEVFFNTDSTFQVNTTIKQIEWDEADIIEVEEPTKDTVFYTIANNGKIVKTQKSHSK